MVLDLVPSPGLDEEAVNTEFVLEDAHMALGRLRFGSSDAAVAALGDHVSRIRLGLVDGADRQTLAALARDASRASLSRTARASWNSSTSPTPGWRGSRPTARRA